MKRAITLTRGEINLDTGEFPVTLMTNGEASDGHIVDISTLVVPETLPMFANHDADPITRMGQLHSPRKAGKASTLGGGKLKMTARIDMAGDSAMADIRRDVAQGIHVGDIQSMSGRWDGGTETARSALPAKHYAHSGAEGNYWGTPTFFEGSTMQEGSIVGLGADKAALVGRSQDLSRPEHVRDFYQMLTRGEAMPLTLEPIVEQERDDLEEIELGDGATLLVPREVARVWGQSIEPATIQPEVIAPSVASRSVSSEERADPLDAIVGVESSAALEEFAAFMRELDARSDAEIDSARRALLYQRMGVIDDGTS